MVSDRLASWRKSKSQHKHGTALLLDSLPQRYRLKTPRSHNKDHIPDVSRSVSPARYDPSPRDLEAVKPLTPELQSSGLQIQRTVQEVPGLEPPEMEARHAELSRSKIGFAS